MTIQKLAPFVGLNRDLGIDTLPLGAVTDTNNVRFRESYCELFLGQTSAYPTCPIAPYSAFPVRTGSTIYWLVMGAGKAYCVTGSPATWTDITRAAGGDYTANLDTCWNGGVLNGVPIVNDGVDVPQYWATIAPGTKLAPITGWTVGVTARVVRPFRNYIFYCDVTKSGTRYPHRVSWSHPADPGALPASFDVTDATKDAGEFDLDGNGFCIDFLPMGNTLVIYKQFSTHIGVFNGQSSIFTFSPLFTDSGMLGPDCGVSVDSVHYVLTQNDVIRHDGQSKQSILDKATRRWLFKNIDSSYTERCFLASNPYFNEVWICFPSLGSTTCDKALVYNIKDGQVTLRDLPGVSSFGVGLVEEAAATTFDADSGSFDSDLSAFNENEFGPSAQRLLLCSPTNTKLILCDSGTQNEGAYISAFIERTGLSLDTPTQVKTISRLRPRVKAPTGTTLTFRVGASMDLYGPVAWSDPVTFTVGTNVSVDSFATGRYLAYRVESTTAYQWRLEGLDVDYTMRGGW